jgi:hypothetical protein
VSALDSPAFPHSSQPLDGQGNPMCGEHSEWGITTRQYAAIKLRVPMSGDAELDAMILESRRLDYAGQALTGMLVNGGAGSWDHDAQNAYTAANAMLAAPKGGEDQPNQWIQLRVYKGTQDAADLLRARFYKTGSSPISFEFQGHRWRYLHDSSDDVGEFTVIERPAERRQP